jgi:hypothetical protein
VQLAVQVAVLVPTHAWCPCLAGCHTAPHCTARHTATDLGHCCKHLSWHHHSHMGGTGGSGGEGGLGGGGGGVGGGWHVSSEAGMVHTARWLVLQAEGTQPLTSSQQLVRNLLLVARSVALLSLPVNLHQRLADVAVTQPSWVSAAQLASAVCHQKR